MTTLFPDRLSDAGRNTLTARLLKLVLPLLEVGADPAELKGVLRFHGLPEQPDEVPGERISLADAKRQLSETYDRYPVAAALATSLDSGDALFGRHEWLLAWALYASVALQARPNSDFHGQIQAALRAVRLPAVKTAERKLLQAVIEGASLPDLTSALGDLAEQVAVNSLLFQRISFLRVLFQYHLTKAPPIQRSRQGEDHFEVAYRSRSEELEAEELDDGDPRPVYMISTLRVASKHPDLEDQEVSGRAKLVHLQAHERLSGAADRRKERQSLALQYHRAKGMAHAISMRQRRLPCSWAHVSALELRETVKLSKEALTDLKSATWRDYLFLMLSLVTGRDHDRLKKIPLGAPSAESPEYWHFDKKGRVLLRVGVTVRTKAVKTRDQDRLTGFARSSSVDLVLPELVQSALKAHLTPDELFPPAPEPAVAIKKIGARLHRAQSSARLAGVLYDLICADEGDASIAGLIVGRAPANLISQTYTSHSLRKVQRAYSSAVAKILDEAEEGIEGGGAVGSTIQPVDAAIRSLFREVRRRLSSELRPTWEARVEFHNLFVIHCLELLNLATGHRPVRNPYENIRDFDLERGFVFISDKEIRNGSGARLVPLAPTAIAQVRAWNLHLNYLCQQIGPLKPEVSEAARGALAADPAYPFLFFIEDDRPQAIAPYSLTARLEDIWPMPLNWGRHALRTRLSGKVDNDLLDAFMGHADIGAEALAPESGLATADLKELATAIEAILQGFGVESIGGLV